MPTAPAGGAITITMIATAIATIQPGDTERRSPGKDEGDGAKSIGSEARYCHRIAAYEN